MKTVTINKINYSIASVVEKLLNVPSSTLVNTFKKANVVFSRDVRVRALKEALIPHFDRIIKERKLLSDELAGRLSYYPLYGEFNYQIKLGYLSYDESIAYLTSLFTYCIEDLQNKGATFDFLNPIISSQAEKHEENFIEEYDKNLNPLFVDKKEDKRFDNIDYVNVRPLLASSYLNSELRSLATKYGVNIPKRLKKEELINKIIASLSEDKKDTEGLKEKLSSSSLVMIERFAKENNLKLSSELKKEDTIELLINHLNISPEDLTRDITKESYTFSKEEKKQFVTPSSISDSVLEEKEVVVTKVETKEENKTHEFTNISPSVVSITHNVDLKNFIINPTDINAVHDVKIIRLDPTYQIAPLSYDNGKLSSIKQRIEDLQELVFLTSSAPVVNQIASSEPQVVKEVVQEEEVKPKVRHRVPIEFRIFFEVIYTILLVIMLIAIVLVIYVFVTQIWPSDFSNIIDGLINKIVIREGKGAMEIIREFVRTYLHIG
ncbi:MAG: hypothetical protein LBV51_03985 [Acholeplasmatales bacterium]|jgi:hypothetical protein|nr:hypothetical protein [Acholeplasmatales bacterium]